MPDRIDEPDEDFRLVPAITDPAQARRLHAENVAAWDQAAADYSSLNEERVKLLRQGESHLHPLERANLARLGPLSDWCREAVHLQCSSGFDALSLLNEGAHHVVGVDISPVHIGNARWVTNELGWGDRAEWYVADVLDTPHELDGRFELVYTGMGALCWIHDLVAWAGVVARLLRPGGVFHVLDNHPTIWMWDDLSDDLRVYPGVSYFDQAGESTSWSPGYLPELGGGLPRKHERSWTFADVLNPLIAAGLRIERLGEHREGYFDALPNLRESEKARIPFSFTLLARRPV